jgi:hypothetical protein
MSLINFSPEQSRAAYDQRVITADTQIEFFTRAIERQVNVGMDRRVKLAARLLRDKTAVNISLPVVKDENGKVIVRSKPGEMPRAETTRLMKDIFEERLGPAWYRVGTTLDYGVILETMLDRSFLRRTLQELRSRIRRILLDGDGFDPPVFNLGDYRG